MQRMIGAVQLYPWSNGLSEQELARAIMAASLAPRAGSEEQVRAAVLEAMGSGLPLLLAEPPAPDQAWDRPLTPADYAAGWNAASKDASSDWSRTAAIPVAAIRSKTMGREWIRGVRTPGPSRPRP